MTDDYDTYSTGEITWSPAGKVRRAHVRGAGTRDLVDTIRDNLNAAVVATSVKSRRPLAERIAAERDALEEMMETIAQRYARKTAQLKQLERWPDEDPFEDGDRLEFTKTFPNSDRSYTYLALKADGLFHITGARSPQGVTWPEFVEWCGLGVETVWKIGGKGGRRRVVG